MLYNLDQLAGYVRLSYVRLGSVIFEIGQIT